MIAWLGLRFLSGSFFSRKIGKQSISLRYGLANLRRHARGNAVQVASLALGLTAVLLLTFTRNDLVDAWRRSSPPDAPNRFLLGVQPDQLAEVKAFFASHGIPVPELDPMVRGRLTAVNGKKVSEADFTEERARRLVEREFNLSFAARPPAHNVVSEGRWFAPGSQRAFGGGGHRQDAGLENGRRADLHGRRRILHRARELAAQAALGLDEGEFLRHRRRRA